MNIDKSKITMEVLESMRGRIEHGLRQTEYQNRDDLRQDIFLRVINVADNMEPISFWHFKEKQDKNEKHQKSG